MITIIVEWLVSEKELFHAVGWLLDTISIFVVIFECLLGYVNHLLSLLSKEVIFILNMIHVQFGVRDVRGGDE